MPETTLTNGDANEEASDDDILTDVAEDVEQADEPLPAKPRLWDFAAALKQAEESVSRALWRVRGDSERTQHVAIWRSTSSGKRRRVRGPLCLRPSRLPATLVSSRFRPADLEASAITVGAGVPPHQLSMPRSCSSILPESLGHLALPAGCAWRCDT